MLICNGKMINSCMQIIQTHIHSTKSLFENISPSHIAKDMTSSLISSHQRYDIIANENVCHKLGN